MRVRVCLDVAVLVRSLPCSFVCFLPSGFSDFRLFRVVLQTPMGVIFSSNTRCVACAIIYKSGPPSLSSADNAKQTINKTSNWHTGVYICTMYIYIYTSICMVSMYICALRHSSQTNNLHTLFAFCIFTLQLRLNFNGSSKRLTTYCAPHFQLL